MAQRRSGHVTLLDVARACGFSVSTVSIVLSEAPLSQNVAATTREQIRDMARQLGYHPDAYARSLRRRRSQTIGVLAFDLSDPFCTPDRARHPGRPAAGRLRAAADGRADAAQALRQLSEDDSGAARRRRHRDRELDLRRNQPARRHQEEPRAHRDCGPRSDRRADQLGARWTTKRRRPGHAPPDRTRPSPHRRHSRTGGDVRQRAALGWRAPRRRPRPASSSTRGWCFNCPAWWIRLRASRAADCARRMLASRPALHRRAGLRRSDCAGVVRGLTCAGLRVPEDCSVLGFDDVLPAEVATPAITTIRQPMQEMGLLAARVGAGGPRGARAAAWSSRRSSIRRRRNWWCGCPRRRRETKRRKIESHGGTHLTAQALPLNTFCITDCSTICRTNQTVLSLTIHRQDSILHFCSWRRFQLR